MEETLTFGVPLVGTLVGAAITYWLNVRTRKRTRREDILYDAIGSVGRARVCHQTITGGLPRVDGATDEEHRAFVVRLVQEQQMTFVQTVAAGKSALAAASAYCPELRPFLDHADPFSDEKCDVMTNRLRERLGTKDPRRTRLARATLGAVKPARGLPFVRNSSVEPRTAPNNTAQPTVEVAGQSVDSPPARVVDAERDTFRFNV